MKKVHHIERFCGICSDPLDKDLKEGYCLDCIKTVLKEHPFVKLGIAWQELCDAIYYRFRPFFKKIGF